MPRVKELPPPPDHPPLSPPVLVAGEELITVPGRNGGPSLEARLRAPEGAERAVLLCHPHPLYGGTMHSAVVLAIAKFLAERGGEKTATLRFNYRGVGTSEGSFSEGVGETEDARAAIHALRTLVPKAKNMSVMGYSFGSWVALRAAGIEGGIDRIAMVAPALIEANHLPADDAKFQGKISIFVGDNDELCDVAEAEDLARELGASLYVLAASDHIFLRSRRKLAEAVLPAIAPEV